MNTSDPTAARPDERRRRSWLRRLLLAVAVAVVVALASVLGLMIREAREAAIAAGAQCHLNQLQLALRQYHDAYGCFPPAYLADREGTPVHSWRVLILPFIEHESLYKAYRFDEPWDGPNNRKLADRMPAIFHMPKEPLDTSMTNIVAIVGPGTAFPGSRGTRIEEFTDGLDNTLLLTEIAPSNICWMQPRDLQIDEMSLAINDRQRPSVSSSRRRGPYAVFADSIHTYQLSPRLGPEMLRALTTIAGDEQMFVGEIDGAGLVSLGDAPVTDDKIMQLSLDDLQSLWLTRSEITDAAVVRVATAPALAKLHLRCTQVTDDGLRHFPPGPPPLFLELCCTQITDDGLQHLAKLTQFRFSGITIDLRGSRVTIAGVARFLKSCPEPEWPLTVQVRFDEGNISHGIMHLGDSSLTDAQLESFRGLKTVYQADLSRTRITDKGLEVVAGFVDLVHLDVSETQITDVGLKHLERLTQLRSLDLRNTSVTHEGISRIKQALPDCTTQRGLQSSPQGDTSSPSISFGSKR